MYPMNSFTGVVIAAIITALGAFFAKPFHSYIEQRRKFKQTPATALILSPQAARRARIRRRLAFLSSIVSLLLIVLDSCLYLSSIPNPFISCPDNAGVSLRVDSLINKSGDNRVVHIHGAACHIEKGEHVWLVALSEAQNVYYLLGNELVITRVNTWSSDITLGDASKDMKGHSYVVSAIIANITAQSTIFSIVSKPHVAHTMSNIPSGAQVMFNITLVRE